MKVRIYCSTQGKFGGGGGGREISGIVAERRIGGKGEKEGLSLSRPAISLYLSLSLSLFICGGGGGDGWCKLAVAAVLVGRRKDFFPFFTFRKFTKDQRLFFTSAFGNCISIGEFLPFPSLSLSKAAADFFFPSSPGAKEPILFSPSLPLRASITITSNPTNRRRQGAATAAEKEEE